MQNMSDTELIDAYVSRQDESVGAARREAAFAELVKRHGTLVYRACHRLLKDHHEARDASQAVFVILARKAGGLRKGELAAWLYRVAHHVAAETVRKRMRRSDREEVYAWNEAIQMDVSTGDEGADPAVMGLVDAALLSLPERYRQAVILRYLQNHSQEEAARLAGCPLGTLSRRASEGIARLRKRLGKLGVATSGAALAGLLTAEASAAVPETLIPSILATVKSAVATTATATTATTTAVMLAQGAMKAMFIAKVKMVAAMTAAAVLLATTVSVGVEQLRDVRPPSNKTPAAGPSRTTTVEDSQFWASPGMGQAHIGAQLITLAASDVARVEKQLGMKLNSESGPVQLEEDDAKRIMAALRDSPSARLVFCVGTNATLGQGSMIRQETAEGQTSLTSSSEGNPSASHTLTLRWNSASVSLSTDRLDLSTTLHSGLDRPTVYLLHWSRATSGYRGQGGAAGQQEECFLWLCLNAKTASVQNRRPQPVLCTCATVAGRIFDLGPSARKSLESAGIRVDASAPVPLTPAQYGKMVSIVGQCPDAVTLSALATHSVNGMESMMRWSRIVESGASDAGTRRPDSDELQAQASSGTDLAQGIKVVCVQGIERELPDGTTLSLSAFADTQVVPNGTVLVPVTVKEGRLAPEHVAVMVVTVRPMDAHRHHE
jgi:RNA polymerase sigma factor (sigma-70 family)